MMFRRMLGSSHQFESSPSAIMAAGATAALLLAHSTTTTTTKVSALQQQRVPSLRKGAGGDGAEPRSGFSFGVIADVQWADAEDGSNYSGTVRRRYRGAFRALGAAVDYWRDYQGGVDGTADEGRGPFPLAFVAQLGDIVDGVNAGMGQSDAALRKALEELDRAPCPCVNLVGNHELYNFDRARLSAAPWLRHGDKEFYSFDPAAGWRIVVLDPYQISLIGHSREDPRRKEAVEILARENPNISPDGDSGKNWFDGIDMKSAQRRFVPYNGGFGREQLDWFRSELSAAVSSRERVIVLSHVIIHPEACGGGTMAWDYEEALDIIHSANRRSDGADGSSPSSGDDAAGVVVAVLCGHDHSGRYHRDEVDGVHHCTFASPLNKGDEGKAYGMIEVTPAGMEIRGPGVDDLLPDVPGRPRKQSCGDGRNSRRAPGPEEAIVLPFGRGWPVLRPGIADERSLIQK